MAVAGVAAQYSVAAHAAPTPVDAEEGGGVAGVLFSPPLYVQRANVVKALLQRYECRRIVDAGCHNGRMLRSLLYASLEWVTFECVIAIDADEQLLREETCRNALPVSLCGSKYLRPLEVFFARGDLTRPPHWDYQRRPATTMRRVGGADDAEDGMEAALQDMCRCLSERHGEGAGGPNVDAVISIEVLEHIDAGEVAGYTNTIFAELGARHGARVVVMTTPNADTNGLFRPPPERGGGVPWTRHPDHRFELTEAQFRRYCDFVLEAYGPYWSTYEWFGVGGNVTQGAVFFASSTTPAAVNGPARPFSWPVESRLNRFPFEEVFGTAPPGTTIQDQLVSVPYTLLSCAWVDHEGLWSRLLRGLRYAALSDAAQSVDNAGSQRGNVAFAALAAAGGVRCVFRCTLAALARSFMELRLPAAGDEELLLPPATRPGDAPADVARVLHEAVDWIMGVWWGADRVAAYLADDTTRCDSALDDDELVFVAFIAIVGYLPGTAAALHRCITRVGADGGNNRLAPIADDLRLFPVDPAALRELQLY